MARFVTLALNPAIDETIELDALVPGTVNIARGMLRHAAGKGINVAACLADSGVEVTATGLLGEANDELFRALFAAKRINDRCARIPGATRTNIKLLDRATGATTDINLPGEAPSPASLDQALAALHEAAGLDGVAVLSGRLPPGVPADVYAQQVATLRSHRARVVLDASGAALDAALAAQALPHAIKPNRQELEAWAGESLPDLPALLRVARAVAARGVGLVVVSMGAEGAIFVTAQQAVGVRPPSRAATSSVGAGDAMVAGIATGLADDLPLDALARRAAAFSAAKLQAIGPNLPGRAEVEAIAASLPVEPLA
ncbi:MAG TPA: 1-phosphofructokinase family hexose kinase [Falsiroseomonas sp.]|jgi:1-phosphofructokinase|nr:1-phosphofructokinase family hexose kinase [Falsiroseomonas sp.]